MCEEESDDSEAVAKLLEINDSIHRTVERYKLIKKGDLDAASRIPKGTLGTSTGVSKTADNELSLIDFSGDSEPTASTTATANDDGTQKAESIEDDLLGLSFQDKNYGQGGGIALGFGANGSELFQSFEGCIVRSLMTRYTDVPGPSLLSSSTQQNSARSPTPNISPQPQQGTTAKKPNYDPFASLTNSKPSSRSTTPAQSLLQSQQAIRPSQPSSDPFAILSSPSPRQPSPFLNAQQSQPPASSSSASLFDFASPGHPSAPYHPSSSMPQQSNGASADDDWTFSSSLPDDSSNLPTSNRLIISTTTITISLELSRPPNNTSVVAILAQFSNNSASTITEYTFQVAVTKVWESYKSRTRYH